MRIGVDLGGTKIEAIALSPGGQEIARLRVTTPRDYAACLDAIAALVRELDRAGGAAGTVGVGIPGTVVPQTGLVKNANSTWLNGQPLERDLAGRLGRPVQVMNDANCFALSEATDGAAAGAPVVFGVILGTGVGGGIVVDGRCDAGAMATLARYHDRLSRALASLINVLDPDVVVLGGGMSNLPGLPEATSALLPRHVLAVGASSDPVLTRVVPAAHGDSSGVRGAAWLWPSSA